MRLDHYSSRTADLPGCIDFYAKALGFVPGPRPDFPFAGAWLYRSDAQGKSTGEAVVHLIDIGTQGEGGLSGYLGDKAAGQIQFGTGAIDHIAFEASGLQAMYRNLSAGGIVFRERRVPGMALHQLFVEDPCGVTLELNYVDADDLAAADARAKV